MRKILGIPVLFLIFLVLTGCSNVLTKKIVIKHKYEDLLLQVEKENSIDVVEYTIYGKHFNIEGNIDNIGDYVNRKLVLKSVDNELEYDFFIDEGKFNTTEYINRGILLDNIPVGNYLVLFKVVDEEIVNYYNLINKTNYSDLEYYTLTKDNKNNKIVIGYDNYNDYNYMYLEVSETNLPDNVYDIIIDPGHGGTDSGAVNGKYHEDEINLEYGLMLRDALSDLGLKIKMTREENTSLKTYGYNSRTSVPYETKAKLMLSIHLNSTSTYNGSGGVEVYIASGDDTYFAQKIADNIVSNTSTVYSSNSYDRIEKGVYERIYTASDIKDTYNTALKEGWIPYEISDNTTYYYFIRETGGIVTKAFADGRNPKYEANPYYNSNHGVEAYLLELGYISNSKNLKVLLNEKEKYVKAIKESVMYYIENNN